MANILLGYPNRCDVAALAGGSWSGSAPLTMLQTMIYSETAASTNLTPANTKFTAAFTTLYPARLVAIAGHNWTQLATWRVRAMGYQAAATNLAIYSEQLDNAAWTKTRTTITANATTEPDGSFTTMDKLVEDSSAANTHFIAQTGITVTNATAYVASVFVKAGERSHFDFIVNRGASYAAVHVNLAAATLSAPQTAGYADYSATCTISLVSTGYYRITLPFTSNGTSAELQVRLSDGTTVTYTGNGTSGLYAWGAQLEAGTAASTYIATVATSVTRSASAVPTFLQPLYDSGATQAYSAAPFGTYDWNESSFWSGTLTDEERAYYPSVATIVLPSQIVAQYWLIEIFDSTNPAGYVEVGRLFICPGWQPTYNAVYGLQWVHETKTQIEESLGGVDFADRRPIIRGVRFGLDFMSDTETYGPGFGLARQQGTDKEVFFVYDPDDTYYTLQRSWPGRMRSLPSFTVANYAGNGGIFEIKELIG